MSTTGLAMAIQSQYLYFILSLFEHREFEIHCMQCDNVTNYRSRELGSRRFRVPKPSTSGCEALTRTCLSRARSLATRTIIYRLPANSRQGD